MNENTHMWDSNQWHGLPYFAISQFYQRQFGGRVYKIPVSVAQTCPNRQGLGGTRVCIFCDQWGSAAFPEYRLESLKDQIHQAKNRLQRRFHTQMFLVYFQAYTHTFGRSEHLREQLKTVWSFPEVKGIVIGTRPDCISQAVLDLWNEMSAENRFVSIELGVQTFCDERLKWLARGHNGQKAIDAIWRIKENTPVDLGIHLIFGLPHETDEEIICLAEKVNNLPIDNVKLHNLHVLKDTELADLWQRGDFDPISRELYIHRVILFLEHLRPDIAVHRLAAVASRHEELLAPHWASSKMQTYQMVLDEFKLRQSYQGRMWSS